MTAVLPESAWLVEVPPELAAIVERATLARLDSITAAKADALAAVTARADYAEWADMLVRVAVGRLVELRRSTLNAQRRCGPAEADPLPEPGANPTRPTVGPAKVWRRLGLAPWTAEKGSESHTLMGSTWKAKGLSAEQWSAFGYSPRRRSVMYVISESLIKQNKSIYRARYDAAKAAAATAHAGWSPMRCHKHAMLLATKLIVRELWRAWNPSLDRGPRWHEPAAELVATN
ncbi:MAG: hypothetical protein E6Q76_02165 [Rhizobium sp.]|nr:MAG: hypothetical protein E6Q76_02165 [Rhizobium sp.]